MGQSRVTESPNFTLSTNSCPGDTLKEGPDEEGPPWPPTSSAATEEVEGWGEKEERRAPMRKDIDARSNDADDEEEDDDAIVTAFRKDFKRSFKWPVANQSGPQQEAD